MTYYLLDLVICCIGLQVEDCRGIVGVRLKVGNTIWNTRQGKKRHRYRRY